MGRPFKVKKTLDVWQIELKGSWPKWVYKALTSERVLFGSDKNGSSYMALREIIGISPDHLYIIADPTQKEESMFRVGDYLIREGGGNYRLERKEKFQSLHGVYDQANNGIELEIDPDNNTIIIKTLLNGALKSRVGLDKDRIETLIKHLSDALPHLKDKELGDD